MRDAVLLGYRDVGLPHLKCFAYPGDGLAIQFCAGVLLASQAPVAASTALDHVAGVLDVVARLQMTRIAASGVVALVADEQSRRRFPMRYRVGNAVRRCSLPRLS